MCYRFSVTKCGCLCVYGVYSYPASAEAARAGRGGAGRFSRMRSGQLTGRRPVHWRERENGAGRVRWVRNIEIDDPLNACFLAQFYFRVSSGSPHFRPQHRSIHMNEAGEQEDKRGRKRERKRALKSTLLFFFHHFSQNTNPSVHRIITACSRLQVHGWESTHNTRLFSFSNQILYSVHL